jgi:hypothetical protein
LLDLSSAICSLTARNRDLLPKTSVVSALYRTPVFVDIQNGILCR